MRYCFTQKQHSLNIFNVILILAVNTVVLAAESPSQIGNSYFSTSSELPSDKKTTSTNADGQIGNSYFQSPKAITKTISQVGAAVEERPNFLTFYAFVNQLLPCRIYYELRAYAIYTYLTQNPPVTPDPVPFSSLHNSIGSGGVGILGYNFFLNSKVTLMPFLRIQGLTNTVEAYKDSSGNQKSSINYTGFLGAKLSMEVADRFAIYSQYYAGYQKSLLTGRGYYSTSTKPDINFILSVLEFGAPYKINKSLSISPYILFVTEGVNPNQAARQTPFSISQLTNTNSVYAIKLGYEF